MPTPTTVVMLGAGIMATALTTPLAENGHQVRLVGTHLDREIITAIQTERVHPNLGVRVPDAVTAYQLEDAAEAFDGVEWVLSGVNSFGVDWAGEQLAILLRPGMHVITLAKGMQANEDGEFTLLPDALASHVPAAMRDQVTWSAVAGPSIAGEVAVGRHTCVVFTSRELATAQMWRELFATDRYHVWCSDDFVGVETSACTKNCYALGAGFMHGYLDALGTDAGDRYVNFNYGAALFGQASVEMRQWVEMFGGQPDTVLGLPGIGDCFVTSMGGRNVKVGRLVGSGLTFSQAKAQMPGVTLEGAAAIVVMGAALERLTELGRVPADTFPLLRHLYQVVALDQPVNVPWDSFFGADGSGR